MVRRPSSKCQKRGRREVAWRGHGPKCRVAPAVSVRLVTLRTVCRRGRRSVRLHPSRIAWRIESGFWSS